MTTIMKPVAMINVYPKVVIFNMTTSSGKDVAAEYLESLYDSQRLAFKDKLIEFTQRFYNISSEDWNKRYTSVNDGRRMKEEPWKRLGGLSQREALIHISENVIKPSLGEGFFGKDVAERLSYQKLNIISDGGFDEEANEIYLTGAEVLVIQRDRLGNGWGNDSRGWLYNPEWCRITFVTVPEGITEVEDYLDFVKQKVENILNVYPKEE